MFLIFAVSQREATAARTVAYLRTLQRQLTGVEVTEKCLRPAVDPKTSNVSFPDTDGYGEFLDSESWYGLPSGNLVFICICICVSGIVYQEPVVRKMRRDHQLFLCKLECSDLCISVFICSVCISCCVCLCVCIHPDLKSSQWW